MQRTSGFPLDIRCTISLFLFAIPWMFHCIVVLLEILKTWICVGKFDWVLTLNLLSFYFLAHFTPTPPTVSGGEGGLLLFFPFPLFQYPLSSDG